MRLLLELNIEVLSAADGSYIVGLDRRKSREDLRWSGQTTESLLNRRFVALQGERRLLPLDWDFLALLAQSRRKRAKLNGARSIVSSSTE
jgi:hypothetical protein